MAFDEGFNSINIPGCNLHVYKYLNNCMFQEVIMQNGLVGNCRITIAGENFPSGLVALIPGLFR
jgi:hypothetical protein